MSDLGVVPVGFNTVILEEYTNTGTIPSGPRSFVSKPSFEFYRSPTDGAIQSLEGTSLLASRVLYSLFTPIGSYAIDSRKGSFLESIVGSNIDKASLMVDLVRSIQKAEDDIKSTSEYIYSSNPDEELDRIKVVNIEYTSVDEVTISLEIRSQSGKVSSLQVEV